VAVFSAHTNVIKITIPKNGGHFERRAMPLYTYIAVYRVYRKFLLAQVILFKRANFRQYFDCLRKKYLIAAMY